MRGVVELPLEKGRKELAWYVGSAKAAGTGNLNPVAPLKVERDADFVIKRWWLVQWPSAPGGGQDPNLALPSTATVLFRDGGTKAGLSLIAGAARMMIPDASPVRMIAAWMGLPCPFLVRANNNLFAELAIPNAGNWLGDIYFVAEGFKVYPYLPEEIPATIKSYAVPFELNARPPIQSPQTGPQFVAGQTITLTNNGFGKFLAKGLKIRLVDPNGVDRTDILMPALGLQIQDTTSGTKNWIQNTNSDQRNPVLVPASLLTYGGTFLSFNTPRYIDQNGVVQIQVVWASEAIAAIHASSAWPITFDVTLEGALLPR